MITLEEALLIFKKWRDEGTPIRCKSSMRFWGVELRGKVDFVSNRGVVRVVSADAAMVELDLPRAEFISYGEVPSGSRPRVLLIAFPPPVLKPGIRRVKVAFFEVDAE